MWGITVLVQYLLHKSNNMDITFYAIKWLLQVHTNATIKSEEDKKAIYLKYTVHLKSSICTKHQLP